jgi:hypothetical protein
VIGHRLHDVEEPQISGHRGLACLQDHALLDDLCLLLLVACVHAEQVRGRLGVVCLQGLDHRVQTRLDFSAELYNLLDQPVKLLMKALSGHPATLL